MKFSSESLDSWVNWFGRSGCRAIVKEIEYFIGVFIIKWRQWCWMIWSRSRPHGCTNGPDSGVRSLWWNVCWISPWGFTTANKHVPNRGTDRTAFQRCARWGAVHFSGDLNKAYRPLANSSLGVSPFSRRSAVYFRPSSFAASLASVSALMASQRSFMRISGTAPKASLYTWKRSSTHDVRGSERFRQYSDAARCSAEKHASVRHIFLQPGNTCWTKQSE